MTTACLALLPTSAAFAGRLFATGHDLDYHCSFSQQCGYVSTGVNYVRGGAPDATKPVLVLDKGNLEFPTSLTNAFGAGVVPTVVMDPSSAAFATTPLTTGLYSAILIASDSSCYGCDLNPSGATEDSDAINLRTADIAAFFNAGGGLLYASGATHGDGSAADDVYYKSAPLPVGGLPVLPPFTLTADGTALGLTSTDANCCATHNSFTDPPAGSSIKVAERDGSGSAETLFAQGSIVGGSIYTLGLAPATGTSATGTPYTVTATLSDQTGPVAGKSVLFTVTGANSASGSGTTNASGQATFTYTGANAGDDTITACADLNNDAMCGGGEPTATATKTWTGSGPPAASCDLALMPAGCWHFGEAPGSTTAIDSSPNHNNGTYVGGVTLGVPGVLAGDTAALFDGQDDFVRVPDSNSLDVGDSFAAEGWIKRSSTTKTHELMNKGANGLQLVVMAATSGNQVWLRKANVTTLAHSTIGITADNRFHHVVATKNGPGSSRIYIDGVDRTAAGTMPQLIQDTTQPLYFSNTTPSSTPATFDEFALYDRALTPSEIAARFALGAP